MAMSNYLEEKILNAALRGQSFPAIAQIYVGLFTTDPGEDGLTGTEVSGGGYARKAAVFLAPVQVNGNAVSSNELEIDFGVAMAVWGTITHLALFDALTAGNMLYHAPMASAKLIEDGDSLRLAPGKLSVSQS